MLSFNLGNASTGKYWHDFTTWSEAELAYLSQADMAALQQGYDTGQLHYSPSVYAELNTLYQNQNSAGSFNDYMNKFFSIANRGFTKYDMQAMQQLGLTSESWAEWESNYFAVQEEEIEEEHQPMLDLREDLIELGVPAYTLDPTPWDEITVEDTTQMLELQVDYEQAQKDEAEAEAEAEALIQSDLSTMTELASLRKESEVLATADVDEYIAEKTEFLSLRGITSPFTSTVRNELIDTRFAEYWSTDNEQRLHELISQYGSDYGYPEISNRVLGAASESLIPTTTTSSTVSSTPSDTELIAAVTAGGASTTSTLLTSALLEDEELEVLGASTLLGG